MKLIHSPITLICQFAIGIVEITLPIHKIISPLSLIYTTLFIVELPEPIPHSILLLPLIPTGLILLHNILIVLLRLPLT